MALRACHFDTVKEPLPDRVLLPGGPGPRLSSGMEGATLTEWRKGVPAACLRNRSNSQGRLTEWATGLRRLTKVFKGSEPPGDQPVFEDGHRYV